MDSVPQREIPEAPRRDLYDLKHGSLTGIPGVSKTKPTTIRVSQALVGDVQTFIVESFRQREDDETSGRNHVFIEYVDARQHVRLYLPPEVAACVARQRDALIGRSRKMAAKAAAADRKARGIVPGFMKHRKHKA